MEIRIKQDAPGNFIEIDLTKEEIENILKGRFPDSQQYIAKGIYTVSVGVK